MYFLIISMLLYLLIFKTQYSSYFADGNPGNRSLGFPLQLSCGRWQVKKGSQQTRNQSASYMAANVSLSRVLGADTATVFQHLYRKS